MFSIRWYHFIGLLAIIFVLVYKYSTRKYGYWKKKNVPEVKPVPFFGSISPVITLKTTIGEWLGDIYNKIDADCFGIYVFDQPILILKSAKLVKTILQKEFERFNDRSGVTDEDDPIMSHVLFFKKNPSWKPVRAKLSPIFTSAKLKAMYQFILEESEQMAEYLGKFSNVPNVEAKDVSARYSTNVIAKCAFAVDAGSFHNENAEFRNLTKEMFGFRIDTSLRHVCSFFAPKLVKIFKIQFFHSKIINSCKRIFKEVLHARRQSGIFKGNDLIDMLIEANEKNGENFFTEDAMVGHAIQFFVAGFETVSSTLSFALYELAIYPELQERLRTEMLECVKKYNGITYAAIQEMKYLDMVICETLRKYPAVPFLDRLCKSDYKVEGSDLVIEKGIPVFIPLFGLHYNPNYFPDPNKFDPERFADKSSINADGMFFVPFGEGPRICIGERFGLLGVKLGLTSILLKFRTEKSSKTPIPIVFDPKSIVLQSKVGLPLKFVPL